MAPYSKRKINSDTQMGIILVATMPLIVTLPFFLIFVRVNLLIYYLPPLAFLAILIIPYRRINKLREGIITYVIFAALIFGGVPLGIRILNFLTDNLGDIIYPLYFLVIIIVSLIVASGIGLHIRKLSKKWNMQINGN